MRTSHAMIAGLRAGTAAVGLVVKEQSNMLVIDFHFQKKQFVLVCVCVCVVALNFTFGFCILLSHVLTCSSSTGVISACVIASTPEYSCRNSS